MAREQTKPPASRLNITYRPDVNGRTEQKELPLRLLFIGGYRGTQDPRKLADRKPHEVNKDNFNEALKAEDVRVEMTVPDTLLGEKDAELSVKLEFKNMSDFGPDAIARKIEPLRRLIELREALAALRAPLTDVPELRKRLGEILRSKDLTDALLKELGVAPTPREP